MLSWFSSESLTRLIQIDIFLALDTVLEFLDSYGILLSLIFSSLSFLLVLIISRRTKRKVAFNIELIDGPNMICSFNSPGKTTSVKQLNTAASIYLKISNTGNSAASIENISIGYKNSFQSPIWKWLDPSLCLGNFSIKKGELVSNYPFLLQQNQFSAKDNSAFLHPGESIKGIVYYEKNNLPSHIKPAAKPFPRVKVKIKIKDSFQKKHTHKTYLPAISLKRARLINSKFGQTHILAKN